MAAFRCGHATGDDWESVARTCLLQIEPGTHGADLGFLYVTDAFAGDLGRILDFVRVRTGTSHWVGSVGMGICAPGAEYFQTPAMAVLTARLPEDSYRVFDPIAHDMRAFEAAHGAWCRSARPRFGVVHADPRSAAVRGVVLRLCERMEGGFLVGGMSSGGNCVQVANTVTSGGVSGVLFRHDVVVATRLTQGCVPIGPRHRVTACDANLCRELDGRRALDVLFDESGELIARDPRQLVGYIFAGLPVKGSDTGDYVVRNIVAIDPDSGIVALDEALEPGDSVMFCRRDATAARQDMERMVDELGRSLPAPPSGGLYFSCVARGPNLFGPDSHEMRTISRVFDGLPVAGFFGNGEVSHQRLYAYTGVLAVFG